MTGYLLGIAWSALLGLEDLAFAIYRFLHAKFTYAFGG